jgi:hypothetical protein
MVANGRAKRKQSPKETAGFGTRLMRCFLSLRDTGWGNRWYPVRGSTSLHIASEVAVERRHAVVRQSAKSGDAAVAVR